MVLDFKDEQLCETLNYIFSGLLPHVNYESTNFSNLYPTLTSVLPLKDTRGLYYVFYVIFDKYYSLKTAMVQADFEVAITRERFEMALSTNLPDLILEPNADIITLMNEEGKTCDLSIPTIQREAMGVLFAKTMVLYDHCYTLAQSCGNAMARLVDLRDVMKANIIETGIQMQRTIVSVGLKYGRHFYRGTKGWLDFSHQLVREVSELDVATDTSLICNNLEMLPMIDSTSDEGVEKLGEYGIPQLDDRTPILRHRLVVIVARENTGKTKVTVSLIASLIRSGVKPFYACGEAKPENIFMQIVSSYIFQQYGMYFETNELSGAKFKELSDDDKQIVQTAKARIAMSGLIISDSLEYDNVTASFTDAYRKGCEAFFVDHTQSLRGRKGRKIGDLVTGLALDSREFKNRYPVYVCLLSHPSTDLKDILQRDQTKDIHKSPTAQSSTPAQEADELFILNSTDAYKKQNILQWIVFKRRDAAIPNSFFIRKLFHVSSFVYEPNIQAGEMIDAQELEKMVKAVGSGFDSDDDDLGLDDDWNDEN